MHSKCVQHQRITSAWKCDREGIHAPCSSACVKERMGVIVGFTPYIEKGPGWDFTPRICNVSVLCAVGSRCQNISISFPVLLRLACSIVSRVCVLFVMPHCCVVTEHLHSVPSDSRSTQRLCIISCVCVFVYTYTHVVSKWLWFATTKLLKVPAARHYSVASHVMSIMFIWKKGISWLCYMQKI